MAELRLIRLLRQSDESLWPFLIPLEPGRLGRRRYSTQALANAAAMIPPQASLGELPRSRNPRGWRKAGA